MKCKTNNDDIESVNNIVHLREGVGCVVGGGEVGHENTTRLLQLRGRSITTDPFSNVK